MNLERMLEACNTHINKSRESLLRQVEQDYMADVKFETGQIIWHTCLKSLLEELISAGMTDISIANWEIELRKLDKLQLHFAFND